MNSRKIVLKKSKHEFSVDTKSPKDNKINVGKKYKVHLLSVLTQYLVSEWLVMFMGTY